MLVKEAIKQSLDMIDILNKYNIRYYKKMCSCPFHGKDKNYSMQINEKSFYCHACGKGGDLIEFVQGLFHLGFQEAMDKINIDFGLGIQTRGVLKKNEIERLNREYEIKVEKELQEKLRKTNEFIKMSDEFRELGRKIAEAAKDITYYNWELKVSDIAKMDIRREILDLEMEELNKEG